MSEEILRPFDPEEEFAAGRYEFDEKLGIGKFNRCYTIPVLDIDGKPFLLGTFQDDHIDFINQARLPDDVFVPTVSQMEKWNEAHICKNWRDEPQKVLDVYGVKFYGDVYHGYIAEVDGIVYLASSSRCLDGSREFLVVYRYGAKFDRYGRGQQCAFIPVFFNREFYDGLQK